MKKSLESFFKEYKWILLAITIACIVIFGIFIFFDRPFLVNADQQLQYNIFYEEWIRLIKEFFKGNGLPLYSWNSFLGTDFWSARAFHVIGDPFLPLLIFIEDIEVGLLVETILCVYCSSVFMNIYLKEFKIEKQSIRNWISIIYAISGFATLFIAQYMFHRFYAFLPLLFFGVERYFNNRRGLWFSFAVALLFMQNYYFMFTASIILFFYCIWSLSLRGQIKIKLTAGYGAKLFGYYIVGFMISAVVVVPAAIYIFQNSRVAKNASLGIFWDLNVYLGLIQSMIVNPFPVYTEFPNIFYSGTNGHAYWYSLYISIVPAIGTISLLLNRQRLKKYGWLVFIVLLSVLIKPIASIMHGFSEATLRYSFLLLFILLVYSAIYYDKYYKKKECIRVGTWFIIIISISTIIGYLSGYIDIQQHKAHLTSIIVSLVVGIFLLILMRKSLKATIIISLVELTISSSFLVYQYNKNYYKYAPSISSEYVAYFASVDEDMMYRMYVDPDILLPSSPMNLNQPLLYGFMSTTTYDSLYEPNLAPFLEKEDFNWHIINIDKYEILNKLGVKYYIVYSKEELPNDSEFEYVYNLNHLEVYKDLNYKSIGYTYTKYGKQCNGDDCLSIDETYKESNYVGENVSVPFNIIDKRNNGLYGDITIEEDSVLFLSIPYNKGWEILVNQKEVYFYNGDGFIAIPLAPGYHEVEMYFVSPGFKIGLLLSGVGIVLWIVKLFMTRRTRIEKR